MKYFLLILSILLIVGSLNPKSLKLRTLKESIDVALRSYKDKQQAASVIGISQVLGIVYCALLAVYFHSFAFTVVMALWMAQIIFDHNMTYRYVQDKTEDKLFISRAYKIFSKMIDVGIYGYIIYFIMKSW